MRSYSKAVLAFGLVAAFASTGWAQGRGPGGGGMMGGVANLISNASVQKELKLEDDQVEKAKGVSEELRAKMRESFSSLQDLEGQERMKKMQELNRTTTEEGMKALGAFLKPEQLKRFKQIVLQQQGGAALADPMVAKKIKLSDEQTGKIQAIMAEAQTARREAMQSAGDDRAAAMEKFRSIQKETNTKVLAVLTDDQKSEWKEMTGEPFEVKFEGGPGGGRRPNN
jgi:hypothetical protein